MVDPRSSPYPECDAAVADVRADRDVWQGVLDDERRTQDFLDSIEASSGDERDELYYELENTPSVGIGAALRQIRAEWGLGHTGADMGKVILSLRYHARIDLGLPV